MPPRLKTRAGKHIVSRPAEKPRGKYVNPTDAYDHQAQRIVKKFGGVAALVEALKQLNNPDASRSRAHIYTWLQPQHTRGTGGLIPTQMIPYLMQAARLAGILLTPADWCGNLRWSPNRRLRHRTGPKKQPKGQP